MEQESREELLSKICSSLKEELVNTRHRAAVQIEALKKQLDAATTRQVSSRKDGGETGLIADALENERYMTRVIDELRASLKDLRQNSTSPADSEKLHARVALLEKALKKQKGKALKRDLLMVEQKRELEELNWLLGFKYATAEEKTAQIAHSTNPDETDSEQLLAWKEAFAILRKHYEEAVAIATNTMREYAPDIWNSNSTDPGDEDEPAE